MTEPKYAGPSSRAPSIADRYDEIAASVGTVAQHFGRTFATRIFRLDAETISLTSLDDDFHEMRIALRVAADGTIVEAVGRMNRHPFDTCPRAVESLEGLVGANVFAPKDQQRLRDRIPRSEGCLHLADMLAIAFRSFRIAKGHDIPHGGEVGRRHLLEILPHMRDTCVSYAAIDA